MSKDYNGHQGPISTKFGLIQPTGIIAEMEKSYVDYAMSVIVSRALPDVRDGLKPVHRRILFAMKEMGLTHKSSYKKSARVVGEVLGKYHPHGDQAVYQTMVRLAQTFSMRYPLVDGQGNFGSIDGDSAAAMRYTEARLTKIASELTKDIDKNTVDWQDNFDGSQQEPKVLPASLPNLLLMGGDGIAVGMATKIPPHNLGELTNAITELINQSQVKITTKTKEADLETVHYTQLTGQLTSQAQVDDLVKHIKGPDFPTAGIIYDKKEIEKLYLTGKASITVRGVAEIVEKKGNFQILISELPYQVNKARLITKIADLVKKKKIVGIKDLRDESDRKGLTVAIDLKKASRPKSILNQLYKHTDLQINYPANVVALTSKGIPSLLNLKTILLEFVIHRQGVIIKRSQFDLTNAKARAHILEGLLIALANIDKIIETIKKSKDQLDAKKNLIANFKLSDLQAEAILEMQLRRLAALEREKIQEEYNQLLQLIKEIIIILKSPEKVLQIIKDELADLTKTYGDKRKTKVIASSIKDFSQEDLVPQEEVIVTLTKSGYIKRMTSGTFKSQRRGGKGVSGMSVKETDNIRLLTNANTHDNLLIFTSKGKVFSLKVWELPDGSRISKGQAIINLINIDPNEEIQAILPLGQKDTDLKDSYLFFTTRQGTIKRTLLSEYANIKSNGLIAINLTKTDNLVWVNQTTGEHHILLVTKDGKSIRFKETDVRATKRDTMGVRGITLKKDDFVVAQECFTPTQSIPKDKRKKVFRDLLIVTKNGLGKRSPLEQYPAQKRGGQGLKVSDVTEKTGKIAGACLVDQTSDHLIITTTKAQAIKLPVKNITVLSRPTQGVILMRFNKAGDSVAATAIVNKR
ncbi:DNA gyrase subunit A [Patescibacteria group bacterium]|nr:DNA gyrase subunit A [Patescibacteria group bacterium]MBU1256538.1 DNA gyrase subunit A [Patescibacteria group bacterium]MBU1457102.1 DNA gyrase subunit A [Patescibacteria group bacterium]